MDFYSVLGLNRNSTENEIKESFKRLALKYHPDRNKSDGKIYESIFQAYSVLTSSERKEYDQSLDLKNNLINKEPFMILIYQRVQEESIFCSCGTIYNILNLENDIIECSTCSLFIKITYNKDEEVL